MRCTRCDRLVLRQVLGRGQGGELIFGWCESCLSREGCQLASDDTIVLKVKTRKSWRARWRRVRHGFRQAGRAILQGDRRLAALGIAGLFAAWALILTFIGGRKLPGPRVPNALPNGSGAVFLAGGGMMAVLSLAVWMSLIGRAERRQVALRLIQVAALIIAIGTLLWGILRHEPRRDPWIVAVVAMGLLVATLARRVERGRSARPTSGSKAKERVL